MTLRVVHDAARGWAGVQRSVACRADRWAVGRVRDLATKESKPDEHTRSGIVDAFMALYQPYDHQTPPPHPEVRAAIIDQFNRLYYHSSQETWRGTHYRGVHVQMCPADLWAYQELLFEVRPELVIETGTAFGGSAYFLGDLCDTLGQGQVLSIDIAGRDDRPHHDRVTYLTGSSVAPDIVKRVTDLVPDHGAVMVILDSDHTAPHVLRELDAYAPLVTENSYAIVEDTNISGHPSLPSFPPGPMEAVEQFIPLHPEFVVDRRPERFMMTFNPCGYLRRVPIGHGGEH